MAMALSPLTSVAVVCRAYPDIDAIDTIVRLIDTFLDPTPCWTLPKATEKVTAGRPRLLKRIAANDPADMEPLFKHERFSSALVHAVRLGDRCVVEWLVEQYLPTGRIRQAVNEAATGGQLDILQWLVERHASRIIWHGSELANAALRNHSMTARWLIEHSGVIYGFNTEDMGLFLYYTARFGDLEMVKWANEQCQARGVRIETGTHEKLFYWTGTTGRDDLVEYMAERFDCPDWHKCLEGAIHGGHLELVKKVQERFGVRHINVRCLAEPAACGKMELVEWTLSNCMLENENGLESAIASAAANGHLDIVQYICMKFGIRFPIHFIHRAAENGHLEVIKWVHENFSGPWSHFVLDEAAKYGHLDVVKWLCENRSDGCSYTAMREAAQRDHLEVVKWLYHIQVKPESSHGEGPHLTLSAMEGAAQSGSFEVVKWLHHHSPHTDSITVMDSAAGNGDLEMVKWLHEQRYQCSRYAMDAACRIGHFELIEWLHTNREEGCSSRAYIGAAMRGHTRVFIWLLCNKPDLFEPNDDMLKAAAAGGNFEILLFANQLIQEEFTPTVDMFIQAQMMEHYEVLEWLVREYAHATPQLHGWLRDKSLANLYIADIMNRYGYS